MYSESGLNTFCKERIVQILKHFIDFCEINDLRYYCSQGTALGARRHQGFIPWDDDIDVMMPRPDYERFLNIYNSDNPDYQLITPYNNENYYLPFAKLIDSNSTLIERRKVPCSLGLFIDIFPIDGMPSEQDRIRDIAESYSYFRLLLSEVVSRETLLDMIVMLLKGNFKRFFRVIKYSRNRINNRNDILENLERITCQYDYNKSELVAVEDSGPFSHPFPKEWLEPYIVMPFETLNVRMPNKTDLYLTNSYGDFMQLPPENERVSCHMDSLVYFNLNEHIECNSISLNKYFFIKKIRHILNMT